MIINYIQYFSEGIFLGLVTGLSCAVFCMPVFIGLTSRNLNNITPVINLVFFLIGRLIAYILVGIIFSVIGMQLKIISFLEFVSKFIIGGLLIYWGIKGFLEIDREKLNCNIKKFIKVTPFFAGILTGISPCPPFIAGITRVMVIGKVLAGVLYFLGFYITTSLFLIPAFITGLVKYKKELKLIMSYSSIIFGIIFLILGIIKIFELFY